MDAKKLEHINRMGRCALESLIYEDGEEFQNFQNFTRATRVEQNPDGLIGVMTTALQKAAEAGEVAGKFAKSLRDDPFWQKKLNSDIGDIGRILDSIPDERRNQILHELSDDIYYISEMCNHFGISILDLMEINVHKLMKRANANTLQGSGDDR